MPCASRRVGKLSVLVVAVVVAAYVAGCGGGGGPAVHQTVSGVIDTDQFIVPQGQTWMADADLTVNANYVGILGNLISKAPTGPANAVQPGINITLNSEGDIDVNGNVSAGNGGAGGAGGKLELVSAQGDITVGQNGSIASGDAGSGAASTAPGLPGATGGDLNVSALNGTVSIHAHAGVLHLGNGGDGGDVPAPAPVSVRAVQMANHGGDCGALTVTCASFSGLPLADSLDTQSKYTDNTNGYITGGRGGDAGTVEDTSVAALGLVEPMADGHDSGPTTGANGGSGWTNGGNGQTVTSQGGNATAGGNGGSATCTGGNGGAIKSVTITIFGQDIGWYTFPCYAGHGGHALSIGGAGGDGFESSPGGKGGAATATGGTGGQAPGGILATGNGLGGNGGAATALGGGGGDGGDNCVPPPGGPGGAGGNGGHATATGGSGGGGDQGGDGGNATATGGDGGDGGDGEPPGAGGGAGGAGASPGSGGDGVFNNGSPGTPTQTPGTAGQQGSPCGGGGAH